MLIMHIEDLFIIPTVCQTIFVNVVIFDITHIWVQKIGKLYSI